jgi:salicylate hydroxylase
MNREANTPLSVAIAGGGIGGLSATIFLRQKGFDVTVFEQASQLSEVGAGLVMAPNAVRLLRSMGALDAFLENAVKLESGWEFRRWSDGTVLSSENLDERCHALYGEDTFTAHRADLLEALIAQLPEGVFHLKSKVVQIDQTDQQARLVLEDGTEHFADVVAGADGVHSIVRQTIAEPGPAEYSGMCAFRALVPAESAPEFSRRPAQVLWIGPDHHLVHYPIAGGKYINLVAFAPAGSYTRESWTATAERSEFLAEFAGWDPRLEELINHAEEIGRWALLDRAPLDRWSDGRMTLLGDAAHPMFPFFAQGAAQSIEDAAVLADALDQYRDDPQTGLKVYEEARIHRTTKLQEMSHARKDINHLPDGPEQQARDAELADGDPLEKAGWIYGYDAHQALATKVS